MANFVRMTISVPESLKERMNGHKADVNWSAVAAQAFERKCDEMVEQNRVATIDDTIARLRMTASTQARPGFRRGYEAGRKWAMSEASADELMHAENFYRTDVAAPHVGSWPYDKIHVQEMDEKLGIPIGHMEPNPDRMESARHAAAGICVETIRNREPGADIWEVAEAEALRIFGGRENCEDVYFLEGFIKAAAVVWSNVKDSI